MSRLPPVPSASKPAYGPDGVPKTSVDISHRLRHQVQRARAQDDGRADIRPPVAGDDLGGAVPARGDASGTWMLVAFGAVTAAIVWLAGRQRSAAAS